MKKFENRFLLILLATILFSVPALFAESEGPVVAIEAFTGTHPEIVGGRAYSDMLMHYLLPKVQGCGGKITEWTRRQDVVNEIEFQQSEYVDKETASEPGQLLQPDIMISGDVTGDGITFRWDIQVKNVATGEILTTDKGTGPDSQILDFCKGVSERIIKKICETESGYEISGQMDEGTVRGRICGDLDTTFTAISPEVAGSWTFTPSSKDGGSFQYSAANVGGVPGTGSGTYRVIRVGGKPVSIKLSGSGAIHSPLGTFRAAIGESLSLSPTKSCGKVGDK